AVRPTQLAKRTRGSSWSPSSPPRSEHHTPDAGEPELLTKGCDVFTTVRTEGAILPADLLQRVAGGRDLDGLTPESYHLTGERLNDAINDAWNHFTTKWRNFREALGKLTAADLATSVTRERWLLPLFQELGYGRLIAAKPFVVEDKFYSVSHAWQKT